MSKVKELVERLCPDGVEYKTLGNCITSIRTGLNPRRNFVLNTKDASNFYITVRELDGFKVVPSSKTDLVNDEALRMIDNRSHLSAGDVLFSGVGTVGRTAYIEKKPLNWNIKEGVYAVTSDARVLDSRYMFWFLRSDVARSQFMQGTDGGTVSSLSMAAFKKLNIPVPPIEVQREVVRILDSFQELDDALTAEIEAREKQLDEFVESWLRNINCDYKPINSVAISYDQKRKPIKKSERKSGIYPYYGASGIVDYVSDYIFDDDLLLLSEDGANLVTRNYPIAFSISGKTWVNNHAHVLKFESSAMQKLVEVYLNRTDLTSYLSLAAQPKLTKAAMNRLQVPVPNETEIERVSLSLADMKTLTSLLIHERDARRRQFSYYRDKLLAFHEKAG